MKRERGSATHRWHDAMIEVHLIWVIGVCGILLGNVTWLPAEVRGLGWLAAMVFIPWSCMKGGR